AIYGIFNKVSILRIQIDSDKCTKCGACQKKCKLDIKVFENPDSTDCIRCGECFTACPSEAISMWKICKNSKKNSKRKSTTGSFIENSPQKC
ncbi:MAG: 4Fe-4S binding protein, partial [Spirochaetales bacterium]|nr:4Fe-4S binding protein [Spirochaetales bacterium]MDY5916210.1 4Fe-4S binding protein [Treponema sp.]